jgi:hypothetical protein
MAKTAKSNKAKSNKAKSDKTFELPRLPNRKLGMCVAGWILQYGDIYKNLILGNHARAWQLTLTLCIFYRCSHFCFLNVTGIDDRVEKARRNLEETQFLLESQKKVLSATDDSFKIENINRRIGEFEYEKRGMEHELAHSLSLQSGFGGRCLKCLRMKKK